VIRVILTAALVLWLVAGCQAAPEEDIPPSSTRDFLSHCPEVMPEVRAFTSSLDAMERTRDEAYFEDMLAAARAIDDIATEARQGLRGANPPEGEWLRELGLAARGFHTLTTVDFTDDYLLERVLDIMTATERATLRCSEESA
jgi:hypothetical protein